MRERERASGREHGRDRWRERGGDVGRDEAGGKMVWLYSKWEMRYAESLRHKQRETIPWFIISRAVYQFKIS